MTSVPSHPSAVNRLRFGCSGIPRSTPRPGTAHGIRRARAVGLDCMELAWGNGVRMHDATADRIRDARDETGLELTVHAPYYVNLCGAEDVVARSVERLIATARQATRCGAASVCFHAGFYGARTPSDASRRIGTRLRELSRRLRDLGLEIELRPEVTGRASQAGTLDEVIRWCERVPGVHPCVDFSHHYARHGGAHNDYEAFSAVLETLRRRLGRQALRRMHVHVSGIEFGPRGERRHTALRRSRFRWRELLQALKDANASGWVVNETPELEADALRLKRCFARLG